MKIALSYDSVTPDLQRMIRAVKRPRTVYEAGAKRVQVELSRHMRKLEGRGNKMGWPSAHFFAGSADSVERRIGITKVTDKSATIEIADPRFVHRITGGTVTAKRKKFLAIPLIAEAYALAGRGSVKESAPQLKLQFPFLGIEKPGGTFEKWFILLRSVTHSPHPDDAPDAEALGTAAGQAMKRALALLLQQQTLG